MVVISTTDVMCAAIDVSSTQLVGVQDISVEPNAREMQHLFYFINWCLQLIMITTASCIRASITKQMNVWCGGVFRANSCVTNSSQSLETILISNLNAHLNSNMFNGTHCSSLDFDPHTPIYELFLGTSVIHICVGLGFTYEKMSGIYPSPLLKFLLEHHCLRRIWSVDSCMPNTYTCQRWTWSVQYPINWINTEQLNSSAWSVIALDFKMWLTMWVTKIVETGLVSWQFIDAAAAYTSIGCGGPSILVWS